MLLKAQPLLDAASIATAAAAVQPVRYR